MHYLFVYGTLKLGFENNKYLANSNFVSKAKTMPNFRLYKCGYFPALVKEENGVSIEGELWSVETFKDLDELEGVEFGLYSREYILLMEPRIYAYVYLFQQSVSDLSDCGTIWR